MTYINTLTDNKTILNHAEWAFEYYTELEILDDVYDNIVNFYKDWINTNIMPDVDNYF